MQDTPIARQDYANMLTAKSRMDQGVGLILDSLEASGRANHTLVIYFAGAQLKRKRPHMPPPPSLTSATLHPLHPTLKTMVPPLLQGRPTFTAQGWQSH